MKLFKSTNICIPAFFALAYGESCFDGNNNGCSHDCSAGVCSCPPCWTLGDDGKTCQFESGKATVTCSAIGAEINIDKCAFPGVDASAINFIDTTCAAVENSENTDFWKISTGFSDCGSTFAFADEKLTLSNTLMIGKPTVGGRVVGRQYNIDFACNFNNIATASSSVNAVNTMFSEITFDIDSTQPTDLSFAFDLAFYESNAFDTAADLSNGAVQPGSPLFGEVAPAATLPGAFEFSVSKCTVADPAISQSLDILDICPAQATSFGFESAQSGTASVKFTFDSFTFPASADNAVLDVNCEVNVCPANSAECLNLCEDSSDSSDSSSSSSSSDSSDSSSSSISILVIFSDLSKSYITNGDGSSKKSVQLSAPSNDYADWAQSAVVQGKLHIFGGYTDLKKIARLDECSLVELPYKLNFEVFWGAAALSISDNSEALICFDDSYGKMCDRFTGTNVVSTHSTTYSHYDGKLGFYNGQPTTIGSENYDGVRKTESLTSTGWERLADHPRNLRAHQLVGLQNGDMLLFAGRDIDDGDAFVTNIWRLSNNLWTEEGNLQQKVAFGSAILHGESIYVFPGRDDDSVWAVQRIDLTNNAITGNETIGNHDAAYRWPALYVTNKDYCVSV